jgi:DNA-binding transcriptional regulator GbsR (MarR family)
MDKHQRTFVDRMGTFAEHDGLSPIAGRLFALLLLADEPRSLDELADALSVSKASVSTDARRLLERGIVERVTRTGDRRDYYELARDFYARIIHNRIDRWRRMQTLANDVRDASDELAPIARERFRSIDDVQSFVIDRLEQALDEWDNRRVTKPKKTAARSRSKVRG